VRTRFPFACAQSRQYDGNVHCLHGFFFLEASGRAGPRHNVWSDISGR